MDNKKRKARWEKAELKKEERLLFLYDLFLHTEKPGYEDIFSLIPYQNLRMLQRDLKDLTDAGLLRVSFDSADRCYKKQGDEIGLPADAKPKRTGHLWRIRRLGILMRELYSDERKVIREYEEELAFCLEEAEEPPEKPEFYSAKTSYYELFPDAAERLRQRDFALLNRVGYFITYNKRFDAYVTNFPQGLSESYGITCENGRFWRDPKKLDEGVYEDPIPV